MIPYSNNGFVNSRFKTIEIIGWISLFFVIVFLTVSVLSKGFLSLYAMAVSALLAAISVAIKISSNYRKRVMPAKYTYIITTLTIMSTLTICLSIFLYVNKFNTSKKDMMKNISAQINKFTINFQEDLAKFISPKDYAFKKLFDKADDALINKNLTKAESLYTKAYNLATASSKRDLAGIALIGIGETDIAKHNYVQAIENFKKALEYKNDIKEKNTIVRIYNYLGYSFNEMKNAQEAINYYSYAIDINHSSDVTYNNRAGVYLDKGDFNKAIADYNNAIKINPKEALYFFNRGAVYYEIADFNKAVEDYSIAIEINPKFVQAYIARGKTYFEKGDLDNAMKDFNTASDVNKQVSGPFINKGDILFFQGKTQDAIENYTKEIKQDTTNANAYYDRAVAYSQIEQYNKALADFNRAIKYGLHNYNCFLGRAFIFSIKQDYEHAIIDYNKAIMINPRKTDAFWGRGVTYNITGNYKKAIRDFTTIINYDYNNADAFLHRGEAYNGVGEYNKAISDYKKALELNPKLAIAMELIGIAYESKIDKLSAKSWYEKALENKSLLPDKGRNVSIRLKNLVERTKLFHGLSNEVYP